MSKKSRQAGANRGRESGVLGTARRGREVCGGSLHLRSAESKECLADPIGVGVIEGAGGPPDMSLSGGPYAEERTAIWGGKAPPVDIEWHRRVYDMNKHLADDLRIGRGVKAGCLFVN